MSLTVAPVEVELVVSAVQKLIDSNRFKLVSVS